MNDRILVKAYANEHGIDFRTVSRTQKSPHRFYILRSELARLEQEPYSIWRRSTGRPPRWWRA